jgi:regulator of sigma E protease
MTLIAHLLQSAVENVVPLVVLLGLLIFVHELGHFLVAKYFKVRVEVFSLGFGPKLLKFKRGDTTYALSAIPLGGYVKMFGDDPTATIESDQQKYSFTHKPVNQRIAVVLAGPIMNFLFAILIFSTIATLGEQALAPKTGDIDAKSAAYAQGFRSGDAVHSVGGESVTTWDEMQSKLQANGDRTVAVELTHLSQNTDRPITIQVTPKLETNKNPLSWDRSIGDVAGLNANSKSSFIGVADPQSPIGKAGLRSGDHIKKVGGMDVTKWRELLDILPVAAGNGDKITFEVERGLLDEKTSEHPASVTATVDSKLVKGKSGDDALKALGIEYPELYLAAATEGAPAAKAGLQVGDRIVSIDGTKVTSFEQIATIIRSYGDKLPKDAPASNGIMSILSNKTEAPSSPLNVVFSREGVEKTASLVPIVKKRMDTNGNEDRHFEIGISPLIVDAVPATVTLDYKNPFAVVSRGVEQTVKWTSLTVLSFVRLFQGEVSPKNVGGFFSIGAMAKKSWQIGAPQFLHVMAIISINLFVLNLLPVPVLDGGHLVFYAIEAIKGAPLSMRKMEIAQQVGLVLLLGLMVFALFNDATRMFFN